MQAMPELRQGIEVGLRASKLAPTHFVPNTVRTLACANECVDPTLVPVTPEVTLPSRCLIALLIASATVGFAGGFVVMAFGVTSMAMWGVAAILMGGAASHSVAAARLSVSRSDQAVVLDAIGTAFVGLASAATLATLIAPSEGATLATLLLIDGPFVLLVPIRSQERSGWRSPLTVLGSLCAAASVTLVVPLATSGIILPYVGLLGFHLCTVAYWLAQDSLSRCMLLPWLNEIGGMVTLLHSVVVGAYTLRVWLA